MSRRVPAPRGSLFLFFNLLEEESPARTDARPPAWSELPTSLREVKKRTHISPESGAAAQRPDGGGRRCSAAAAAAAAVSKSTN